MEKFRSLKDRIDNSLLEERKVFLWGMVSDESARHVVERLIYLDSVDPGKEISLIINSPGGYVTSGFAIHDTIKTIKSPVSTVCMGLAESMGTILLSAGAKGKRFIYTYAKVMIDRKSKRMKSSQ